MSQFHFKNFEPDFEQRFHANLVMNKILDSAPCGATGVGLIERKGESEYLCMLDVYLQQGPFIASAVGSTPDQAMKKMEEKIKKQIHGRKSKRQETSPHKFFGKLLNKPKDKGETHSSNEHKDQVAS